MAAKIPFRRLILLMHNRFLNTSSTVSSSSFTVNFLMNSCGLSLQSALSTSKKIKIYEHKLSRHESVVNFLKSHGFDNTHLAKVIVSCPRILNCEIDDNLKPKFEYLIEKGFMGSLLLELILVNPNIVKDKSLKSLQSYFDFLTQFLGCQKRVITAVKRMYKLFWILNLDLKLALQPSIDFLISEGLTMKSISLLFIYKPRALLQVDRIARAVKVVKRMGVEPSASIFVCALRVILSMSDITLERKVEIFKSLGWSEQELISTFKRDPFCFSFSEEKLRSAMDFYLTTMKLDANAIIAYPMFLNFSIDKRLCPRYNVLKVLVSKNLLKESKKLIWVMVPTEKIFLENFVIKHLDQVPGLMEIYSGNIVTND